MKSFYRLLGAGLLASTTNNFVWFALTYWSYLQTQSVVSTGFVGGIYLIATAVSGFWVGSIVDHYKKKYGMLGSSIVTLAFFSLGFLILSSNPASAFSSVSSPILWVLVLTLLLGSVSGNLYGIAIPTLVTVLVPEKMRDRANGMLGMVWGISFAITSVASGLVLAFGGMHAVLLTAVIATILVILYVSFLHIPEKAIIHTQPPGTAKKNDFRETLRIMNTIPGLFALIFFTTFNNFIGGVFMALMDAYGLSLVSVQVWGTLWGFLSLGFILSGLYIAKNGLGSHPLKTLFRVNMVIWTICILFPIQPSIVLLTIGSFVWMFLFPFVEAIEQTIIQKVVPAERQGRVFGFAHSIEQSASPLTAFFIGPITQFIFIPFMTTGAGVDLIGDWFGTGTGRGIAIVFILAGIIGVTVTTIAMRSKAYSLLSKQFAKKD